MALIEVHGDLVGIFRGRDGRGPGAGRLAGVFRSAEALQARMKRVGLAAFLRG